MDRATTTMNRDRLRGEIVDAAKTAEPLEPWLQPLQG
jgi:hypothetical protein